MVWYNSKKCAWDGCQNESVNCSKFCVLHRNKVWRINWEKKKAKEEKCGKK